MIRANQEIREGRLGSAQWYWLKFLWGQSKNAPEVQQVWWDSRTKEESQRSKWENFNYVVLPYDHRTVNPKEIVFDIDFESPFKTFEKVRDANIRLHKALQKNKIPHILTQSGGRAFHQHIFYKSPLSRVALAKKVLKKCGMLGFYGDKRPIDPQPINHSRHMIRMIGGRKIVDKEQFHYKTLIDDIPDVIKPVVDKKNVRFPEEVEIWNSN